jgi:hypothetical protein
MTLDQLLAHYVACCPLFSLIPPVLNLCFLRSESVEMQIAPQADAAQKVGSGVEVARF